MKNNAQNLSNLHGFNDYFRYFEIRIEENLLLYSYI